MGVPGLFALLACGPNYLALSVLFGYGYVELAFTLAIECG